MAVNIVTGRKGEAHITSDDERMKNAEMFGEGKFVFDAGGRLWAKKLDNTHVRISSGMCMSHGTQMGVELGDTETITFDQGAFGYERHDLIVMRYERDIEHDTESATLAVIKGTPVPVASNPQDPQWTDGDILTFNVTLDETPLWRVVFEGENLVESKLEPMYELRSGYTPTNPDDPDQHARENGENSYVITGATIDRLWGTAIDDADTEGW